VWGSDANQEMGVMRIHNGRPLTALVLVLSLLLVLPGCFAKPIPQDQVDFFRALSSTQYWTTTAVNFAISDVNGNEVTLLDKVQPGKEAFLNFRDFSITVGTADRPVTAHIAVGVSDGSSPLVTTSIDVTSANMVALQEALKKMESSEHRSQRLEAARPKKQTPKVTPKVTAKAMSPDGLMQFLTTNFSTCDTSLGSTSFTFSVSEVTTEYITEDYDIDVEVDPLFFDVLQYGSKVTTNMNHVVCEELKQFQEKIAETAIAALPDKKLRGTYLETWYDYPTIRAGFHAAYYYSWVNYNGNTITGFSWDAAIDSSLWR